MYNKNLSVKEIENVLKCGFILMINIGIIFYKNNNIGKYRYHFKTCKYFNLIANKKLFIRSVLHRISFNNFLFKACDIIFILYSSKINSIYFL